MARDAAGRVGGFEEGRHSRVAPPGDFCPSVALSYTDWNDSLSIGMLLGLAMRRTLCLLIRIVAQTAPSSTLGASSTQTTGPHVILGVDPADSQRYVQPADRGMAVFPTADMTCDGNRRTLPLTRSDSVGDKIIATYAVPPKISEEMLKAVECWRDRLALLAVAVVVVGTAAWFSTFAFWPRGSGPGL